MEKSYQGARCDYMQSSTEPLTCSFPSISSLEEIRHHEGSKIPHILQAIGVAATFELASHHLCQIGGNSRG